MSSIRVEFARGEEVKFISHLDLMKVFERALRRSKLPISYSKGFNPHPNMVFGLPLSVGVTSDAEYADFEMEEGISPAQFKDILNLQMPKGLLITKARHKLNKTNIMATISAASYVCSVYIDASMDENNFKNLLDEFLESDEIFVTKITKKRTISINIRPNIYLLKLHEFPKDAGTNSKNFDNKQKVSLNICLSAGSVSNIKPELLISAINEKMGTEIQIAKIHRTGLYVSSNGKIVSPINDSVI